MKNQSIYEYAQKLAIFNDSNLKLPVRINFYLQKNIQLIQQAAQDIEQARFNIGAQYGTLNSEGTGYDIPSDNINIVNNELNDLFDLEQELNIHMFKIDDFGDIDLTYQQMSAILFMIEE